MSNADVLRAKSLHSEMLGWESRGPGDLANAMTRLARRYALPFPKQWALRYRPPKEIASHILARLEAAHAAEKQRQLRMLARDTTITATIAGADHHSVVAAATVLGALGRADAREDPRVVGAPLESASFPLERVTAASVDDLPLWRSQRGVE